METLYRGNYGSEFRLDSRYINKITFYDDNGIVCVCNKDIYKEDNKEEVEQLNILQVLKTDKSFRKQETEQEFINKQMKKKINFSYVGKEKKWYLIAVGLFLFRIEVIPLQCAYFTSTHTCG